MAKKPIKPKLKQNITGIGAGKRPIPKTVQDAIKRTAPELSEALGYTEDENCSDPTQDGGNATSAAEQSLKASPVNVQISVGEGCLGYQPSLATGRCRCAVCKSKPLLERATRPFGDAKPVMICSPPVPVPKPSMPSSVVSSQQNAKEVRIQRIIKDHEIIARLSQKCGEDSLKKSILSSLGGELLSVDNAPHVICTARAGVGKTTSIVEGLKDTLGFGTHITPSPQQRAIWDALKQSKKGSIAVTAFSNAIVKEIKSRIPPGVDGKGIHSMGFSAVGRAFRLWGGNRSVNNGTDYADYRVERIIEEILNCGDLRQLSVQRRQMCKIATDLVGYCKVSLTGYTPGLGFNPFIDSNDLDKLCSYYDIDFDGVSQDEVYDLVPKVLQRCLDVEKDRYIDFNDMVWCPTVLGLPLQRYDLLIVDEAQDLNRAQQELVIRMADRLMFIGDDKQCHTPDTMITMEGGERKQIKDVKVGDRVMTFNPNAGQFSGRRSHGRMVQATHVERGPETMVRICYEPKVYSYCTPGHRWWCRISPDCAKSVCTYLMRKGNQYRVGVCRIKYGCGIGVSARARDEDADAAWILGIFDTQEEARVSEEIISAQFGLPQVVFRYRGGSCPSQEFIDAVYAGIGDNSDHGLQCLKSFGREVAYPLWARNCESTNYLSTVKGFVCHASNLIDKCFQFRFDDDSMQGEWVTASINRVEYDGDVHGITVEPTERNLRLYIADRIVSHNSIFGFAGSDCESMSRLKTRLSATERGCVVLPLTVTRRCGKAIVMEANKIVPDFQAHESNCEGVVSRMSFKAGDGRDYRMAVKDGDMVLCRVNAPLVSEFFRFIKAGKKAVIQGRDVGKGIVKTIEKQKAQNVGELIERLEQWAQSEQAKEGKKKFPSEARMIGITDKLDCILAFCDGVDSKASPRDIIAKVDAVFTDNRDCPGIRLSTAHKSKGLEAHRVFLLEPEGASIPHPMCRTPWAIEQDWNLRYVAVTRAIESLTYVS